MKYLKLILLALFLFMGTSAFTQINVGDGVTIAHFNAEWNSANAVEWVGDIEECNLVKVDIVKYNKMQTKHKIVVVPTIILFKDGEEIKRWQANVSFKIEETLETIQEAVDEQNLSDF